MAGKKKIPKEYDDHYKGKKKKMSEPEYTQEGVVKAGDPDRFKDFYPKGPKRLPDKPKAKAKAKKKKMRGPKELIKEGVKNYKAADKYFAEKWKQRDLKKQIAKKKKKAKELRDAKAKRKKK